MIMDDLLSSLVEMMNPDEGKKKIQAHGSSFALYAVGGAVARPDGKEENNFGRANGPLLILSLLLKT